MNSVVNSEATHKSLLKNALLALDEMQARLDAAEQARHAPVAIVGLGCRFPGGANDPDAYWQLLLRGVDAVRELPPARRPQESLGDPDLPATWYGGFLDDIDQFDPHFFGISPREAASMDPQQRLVLEVGWEALEAAGQAPDQLVGSLTGVFLGITTNDYGFLLRQAGSTQMDAYAATGGALNAAAGRLAFTLGLQGPTLAVDTACSSSLVAIHLACQSLRNRECNMALAGGVNATLTPEAFVCFARWGMMAPDGRCKTFDAAANGFVRGEGCGMVVLKRLDDAIADGDRILAVLRGSAVNQDGRSSGLTVPNGLAQQAVLRQALAAAGVKGGEISYVETHGTGTALGDPIEVEALGAVLGEGRTQPLVIGSVKTNLGHLESAAGVAGLIKLVLSLQHATIPPHLHFQQRNPQIPWPAFSVEVPVQPLPWPRGAQPRLAGISGFGFSGTNAHLVVAEAPLAAPVAPAAPAAERPLHVVAASAMDAEALAALVARYAGHLAAHPELALPDLAYTANTGRSHFSHRLAVVAPDSRTLQKQLQAIAGGQPHPHVYRGVVGRSERHRLAFLFTGQGAQYVGMGRTLYTTQPAFRRALDECAALFAASLARPLLPVLLGGTEDAVTLDDTTYTQPALFAIEYALATMWQAWGICPSALLGHSIGEYVAAVLAGVMCLEDAVRLVAARGRLMGALPRGGAMAAVFADPELVAAALAALPAAKAGCVAIAAYNGPQHVVISGDAAAVAMVLAGLAAQKVESRSLAVSHAFHSPLMAPILDEFERLVGTVPLRKPQVRLISNLTGAEAGAEITTPAYWRRHIVEPVAFAQGMAALHRLGYRHFLEIGPQPVLLGMGRRCLPQDGVETAWLPSLRQGHDDWETLLASLASLYTLGAPIDWQGFDRDYIRHRVQLPTYPFQRQRYWLDAGKPKPVAAAVRPLIDKLMRSPATQTTLFETEFSAEALPYLADHLVYSEMVAPGACQLAMALNAAEECLGTQAALKLEDVVLPQALLIPAGQERTVQAIFSARPGSGRQEFKVVSFAPPAAAQVSAAVDGDAPEVLTHATGYVTARAAQMPASVSLGALQQRCTHPQDIGAFYAATAAAQLQLGPAFRWLAQVWRSADGAQAEALARLVRPAVVASLAGYALHPGLLDACFQVAGFTGEMSSETSIAFAFGALELHRPAIGSEWWCHVRRTGADRFDIVLLAADGEVVASLKDFQVRAAPAAAIRGEAAWREWLYVPEWQPQPLAPAKGVAGRQGGATWLILADEGGVGTALAAQLRAQDDRVVIARAGAGWRQEDQDMFWLGAGQVEDYRQLVANLAPLYGVIHLWSLESGPHMGEPERLPAGLVPAARRGCESALLLAQALAGAERPLAGLWLVTQDAQAVTAGDRLDGLAQGPLWGLGKVMALEHPELNPICIDLPPANGPATAPATGEQAALAALLRAEITQAGADPGTPVAPERQVALRAGGRYVARLRRFVPAQAAALPDIPRRLEITERGLLDNLQVRPCARRAPAAGEVEIQVQAAGLNFRDVLNALGAYPGDPGPVGGECAGIVVAVGAGVSQFAPGDSVVAMAAGSFSRYLTVAASFVAHKPAALSAVAAAGVPTAFLTAWCGLHYLAQMKAGDRVLIHAAAGGVGMAAVQLARQAGAEVFATASPGKWEALRALGVTHLYHSRTTDFAAQILADTEGAGVQIILNSLTGPGFMEANLAVLAQGGYLAEMSKRNIWTPEQVAAVRPDVRYTVFDLGEISQQQPHLWQEMLAAVFDLLAAGELQPLPCTVFPLEEAVAAFRLMQQARHVGKVVLTLSAEAQENLPAPAPAIGGDGVYLITGGLGGLGLVVAQGLVEQGARHLLLVGRRPPDAAARGRLDAWAAQGVAVTVAQGDASNAAELQAILRGIDPAQPLRGVVHAAGVLDDGALLQQNWARFTTVWAPKVQGAWNLHRLTAGMALDFFVLFSSASALLGSRGQSNYVAANGALDALAHYRQAQGLCALSINWGAWAEVGMAAGLVRSQAAQLAAQGIGVIAPAQGVAALLYLLGLSVAQVGVVPIYWPAFLAHGGQHDPFYTTLRTQATFAAVHEQEPGGPDIGQQLRQAASPAEHRELLHAYLAQQVAQVLRVPPAALNADEALTYMGLDSLMALELRNRIDAGLQLSVPVPQLLQGVSINDLLAFVLEKQQETKPATPAPARTPADRADLPAVTQQDAAAVLAHLDEMTEENVDLLLQRLLAEEGLAS